MKTIRSLFLFSLLITVFFLSGCQEEDLADINDRPGRVPTDKAPNPVPALIPPSSVIKTEHPQATSWLATWEYPFWENKLSLARVFNTTTGTFHSINSLNASGFKATAQADMDVLFGRIQSLEKYDPLIYKDHAPKTRFVPSDLTYLGFLNAVQYNPSLFQEEYESRAYEPTRFQPYNYEAYGGDNVLYQSGEIYLFKTDSEPPKYGAIRIVQGTGVVAENAPRIIEIVVAKPAELIGFGD